MPGVKDLILCVKSVDVDDVGVTAKADEGEPTLLVGGDRVCAICPTGV